MSPAGSHSYGGTVDRRGRLLSADARLLALQLSAGGDADGPIAIPRLASIVRLARTLGMLVSRTIIAAEGDRDLELLVRAQPEGQVIRLAISGWDDEPLTLVTPEHAAERQAHLALLSSDAHWETDAALKLVSVDDGLARLIGDEWKGERLTRLFELKPDADGDFPLLDAVLEGKSFSGQAASTGGPDGRTLWLHGKPKIGGRGSVAGYEGGLRWTSGTGPEAEPVQDLPNEPDVPLEDRFPERLDQALRAPIGRIVGQADAIASRSEGSLADEYASYAEDIASAGRHLLGLVDDLADLQAVERPGFEVATEPLDLADVARRAAGLLGVRATDRQVRIDAPHTDETLLARADFRRALQIMVNLVGNAVRYSPAGSMVWIRAEREGDVAALIVADQGKGIALADQDRIFGKFERVDPSEPGGSGLGLYISRQLARAMGGDINVDSAPGQGARFVLTLPAA